MPAGRRENFGVDSYAAVCRAPNKLEKSKGNRELILSMQHPHGIIAQARPCRCGCIYNDYLSADD